MMRNLGPDTGIAPIPYFVVSDGAHYRFEPRRDQPTAIAAFNNKETAQKIKLMFDDLFMRPTISAFSEVASRVSVSVSSIIIPEKNVPEGILVDSTSVLWGEIVRQLQSNWELAYRLPADKWEEIIAGAFKKALYDEVILTPRSGDHGRDIIAIRHGVGCVKVIGSVKAYSPHNLVPYDAIRALLGVLSGELNASKGIITTTSDFPPRIMDDPYIAPFVPTRLELMNGEKLRQWLAELNRTQN